MGEERQHARRPGFHTPCPVVLPCGWGGGCGGHGSELELGQFVLQFYSGFIGVDLDRFPASTEAPLHGSDAVGPG
ncbi:hypothetical protein BKM31_13655 [[Actinomadura] parvosata subsp. kistnae]|uniref:Uncharacterized protein n=1 Tax=[Actinomadura] parvosata subsp. kistnae TaxID=1909395 RepID=A0A1U9ZWS8_9ACTN|nr:hypothetical protein BKM31_13655 [Nonomuraea sp. ATCC 55076]